MNTYSVVVLGARRAGKTVFIASLFNKLAITHPELGFYLEAGNEQQRKILNKIYKEVATGREWPAGTNTTSEWIFTVKIQNYGACQFKYLDYAGGIITDPDIESNFDENSQQADVVLGILDGQKILALMIQNQESKPTWVEEKVDDFLYDDLPNVLQSMQNLPESEGNLKPIHFLISKWDLLENNFTLEQIRDRLLKNQKFNNFAQERIKKGCTVRLIPVSAVGKGFAKILPDGVMQKIGLDEPEPFQLEMSLACILPDKVETELKQIQKKSSTEHKIIQDALNQKLEIPIKEKFDEKVGKLTRVVSHILPFKKQLQRWADSKQQSAKEKRKLYFQRKEELELELRESKEKISSISDAFKRILSIFEYLEGELTEKFPGSKITQEDLYDKKPKRQ